MTNEEYRSFIMTNEEAFGLFIPACARIIGKEVNDLSDISTGSFSIGRKKLSDLFGIDYWTTYIRAPYLGWEVPLPPEHLRILKALCGPHGASIYKILMARKEAGSNDTMA